MIKEKFPQVRLILNKENVGFGRANNQGIEIAKGKYILFLNSDTIVKEKSLQNLIGFLNKNEKIGILGAKLILKDGSIQPWAIGYNPNILKALLEKPLGFLGKYFAHNKWFKNLSYPFTLRFWEHDKIKEIDWVTGAALLIRKSVLNKIGGFDPSFFLYFEDVDLCFRARKAGYKVLFYPEAEIIHFGGGSITSSSKQKEIYYQSQKYFYKKHYSWFSQFLLLIIRWPYKKSVLNKKIAKNERIK